MSECTNVLQKNLIDMAWDHKFPEAAIDYGKALLAAASEATAAGSAAKTSLPKRGLFSRLGLTKNTSEPMPFEEQLDIVGAAGRWFIFWGERGHAIRAWF